MPINEIVINVNFSQEDYLKILRARINYTQRKIKNAQIAYTLLLAFGLYLSLQYGGFNWWILFIALVISFSTWFTLSSQTKLVKSPLNRNAYIPTQYIFNEEGIREKSELTESKKKWAYFVGWQKLPGFYLLFENGSQMIPIPENNIPEAQRELFKKLIEDNIQPLPKK